MIMRGTLSLDRTYRKCRVGNIFDTRRFLIDKQFIRSEESDLLSVTRFTMWST